MAHSPNGRYVKIEANVWLDAKTDTIKVTSRDPDIPNAGIHFSAKRGTKTEANLRQLLENMCGDHLAAVAATTP